MKWFGLKIVKGKVIEFLFDWKGVGIQSGQWAL